MIRISPSDSTSSCAWINSLVFSWRGQKSRWRLSLFYRTAAREEDSRSLPVISLAKRENLWTSPVKGDDASEMLLCIDLFSFFDLAHHFIRWIKYLFAGISKFCPLPRLESHATRSKQRSITQWTNQKQGNEPYQKLRVVCNIYFKKEIYRLMKPLSVTGCTHRLQSPVSKRLKTGW